MAAPLARILFILALLGQALTASSSGAGALVAGGDGARICVVAHAEIRAFAEVDVADDIDQGSKSGHKSGHAHRNGACAYCSSGTGGSPLLTPITRFGAPSHRIENASILASFPRVAFSRDPSNAATRAPPILS